MNERLLQYALTVWRERSFSRAAQKLHVTQPTVSDQVRRLEESIGFDLFVRTGRGVEVTHKGRTYLHRCEDVLSGLKELDKTARRLRGETHRSFALGFSSSMVQEYLPRTISALRSDLRDTRIQVITATTRRVQRFVAEGRVDVGFTVEADPRVLPPQLTRARIGSASIGLIHSPDDPLGTSPEALPLDRIATERLIVHEPDVGYGEKIQQLFHDQGLEPNIAASSDDIETLKFMVQAGVGVALVPVNCARNEVELGLLGLRPLDPEIRLDVTMIERELKDGAAANPFIDSLRRRFGIDTAAAKDPPDPAQTPDPAAFRSADVGPAS